MSEEKTYPSAATMTFVGIAIDTVNSELRLRVEQIAKATLSVENTLRQKKISLVKLQSLISFLNLAGYVVAPGRAFLRRFIHVNLTRGVKKLWHMIWLGK